MVAVLAQMCMLDYEMTPYLVLGLVFLGVMIFATMFVVRQGRLAGVGQLVVLLVVIRECRYILYPGMLVLTEQPYTQLTLVIFYNLVLAGLCLLILLFEHSRCRWTSIYCLVESLGMFIIEAYLLANQRLPLGIDYFMISLMVFMISLYTFVSLRLIFFGLKRICFALGKWLKGKKKKSMLRKSLNNFSSKSIRMKSFSKSK